MCDDPLINNTQSKILLVSCAITVTENLTETVQDLK